ncbi:OmpH family outer membrane protein [Thiocapsa sp.]|uniref:OmpH family outer membrane protein n=1 Tax=Thiocapsa sp. TaxID=2024551 RepID=UPI00261DDF76|nr:OmpH family outer membrane protein [Thiocapsa sp.]
MRLAVLWSSTIALILVSSLVLASDYRIAVVDPNTVVEQSPQYEAARAALQREVEDRERILREQQDQISALQGRLEREGALMSESEIQRLQNDIRSRTRKLKYARDEFQEDFALRQNELRTKLALQVREVIVEVAKEEEIDLVISEGLVYFSPRIDISAQVIERLKQEFGDK